MIEMQHHRGHKELQKYHKDNPNAKWGQDDFWQVRDKIRHDLHTEQQGLCVYCEKKIGKDEGHVEHIQPKGKFPALSFVFDNLAHSCNGTKHCGHFKDNNVLPVEPRPGCNRYFALMARDGKLVPASDLNEDKKKKAKETLRILGLNTSALTRQRQQFAMVIRSLDNVMEVNSFLQDSPFRWSLQGS